MLSSGSCEVAFDGLGLALTGGAESVRQTLAAREGPEAECAELDEVARDFAAVFYTTLVRQMQRTLQNEEEESAMSDGARGFFTMFMPRALARSQGDPLAGYLRRALDVRYGERLDETG